MSFGRDGMTATISIQRHRLSLRDIIGDRKIMREQGAWLIKQLLHMMLELFELKICCRAIQPSSISVDLETR